MWLRTACWRAAHRSAAVGMTPALTPVNKTAALYLLYPSSRLLHHRRAELWLTEPLFFYLNVLLSEELQARKRKVTIPWVWHDTWKVKAVRIALWCQSFDRCAPWNTLQFQYGLQPQPPSCLETNKYKSAPVPLGHKHPDTDDKGSEVRGVKCDQLCSCHLRWWQ